MTNDERAAFERLTTERDELRRKILGFTAHKMDVQAQHDFDELRALARGDK